jgi:hypothetical protein
MALFLSSCHSNYLNYKIEFSRNFAWNRDSSAFAFSAVKYLFKRPVGIATFPDGGRVKQEYYDAALYYYSIKDNKLNRIVDFKDILRLYPKSREYYSIQLAYTDSLIYYKLSDADNYSIREAKRFVHSEDDSIKLYKAIKYVSVVHSYNVNTKKISEIDSATFNAALSQLKVDKNQSKRSKEYLTKLSYADWGIVLKNIYPQSKKTYMEYIVYKQGNSSIRDAVFEQIIPSFTRKEIQMMLNDMDEYKSKLDKKDKPSLNYKDHSNKLSYDEYYESTCKKLRKFL